MKNNLVYIFLICLVVYYLYSTFKETFLIVGYNNSIVPNYTINNLFDEETKLLDSQFSDLSLDRNFNIKSFTLFNTNISFPFTNQFQKLLLSFLKTVPRINKHKITLSNFNNIFEVHFENSCQLLLTFLHQHPLNHFRSCCQLIRLQEYYTLNKSR